LPSVVSPSPNPAVNVSLAAEQERTSDNELIQRKKRFAVEPRRDSHGLVTFSPGLAMRRRAGTTAGSTVKGVFVTEPCGLDRSDPARRAVLAPTTARGCCEHVVTLAHASRRVVVEEPDRQIASTPVAAETPWRAPSSFCGVVTLA
jgi:hypothetical protein